MQPMKMLDEQVANTICVNCGTHHDRASGIVTDNTDQWSPKSGDVSICISCGHISVWGDDMKLRNPTPEEMYSIAGDPKVIAATTALHRVKKEHPGE